MWTAKFQMFKLVLEKAEETEIKLPTSVDHQKSKRVPEKHLFLLYWLCQSLWLCGSPQTVENSERDGNTRPSDLPLEKSVCRSGSNRAGHGTVDWFQIGKWVRQSCGHHSSTLAWKIPWTEEPDRLLSMGSHRVGHDWSDLAAAAASKEFYRHYLMKTFF